MSRQNVGVEHLTLDFPLSPYRGFGREAGFNAIYFWSAAHCWVRDVAVVNADAGVVLDGTQFCTVSDVELTSGPRGVDNGAWGVWLKNGADNLITGLAVTTRFVRDVAVQGVQVGTVVANSAGLDLAIDLLYGGPYGTLVSNVDAGYGSRLWGIQSNAAKGTSYDTWWNVKTQIPVRLLCFFSRVVFVHCLCFQSAFILPLLFL
jgi:hypothetical protein